MEASISSNSRVTMGVVILIIAAAISWGIVVTKQEYTQRDVADVKSDLASFKVENDADLKRLEGKIDKILENKVASQNR